MKTLKITLSTLNSGYFDSMYESKNSLKMLFKGVFGLPM